MPVEDPVLGGEDLLQVFQLESRRHAEHAVSIETSIGAKDMQVRMEL